MIPPGFVGCADCPPDAVCGFCQPRLDLYLALLGEQYGHVRDESVDVALLPSERSAVLESADRWHRPPIVR